MLLLSSLLGPAKPPVATREDVEQAKGVFVIEGGVASLVAYERHGSEILPLSAEERCLICLDGYQVAEELRKLSKCSHIFHRSCVDEVSPLPLPPPSRQNISRQAVSLTFVFPLVL